MYDSVDVSLVVFFDDNAGNRDSPTNRNTRQTMKNLRGVRYLAKRNVLPVNVIISPYHINEVAYK